MMGITHLALGTIVLFLLQEFTTLVRGNELAAAALILIASILPDIDSARSYMGRWLKPVKWLFKHRGFFHSIVAMVTFTVVVQILFHSRDLSLVFLAGYSSHLLADSVTKEGTRLFYPRELKTKGPLRVGSFAETAIIFVLIVLALSFLI